MYISATQISMFCRCPQQYYRRYILNEIAPPGIAMIQGNAIHFAAATNFRQKKETRRDLPVEDIIGCAVAEFDNQAKTHDIKYNGIDKDAVVRMAKTHATQQAPVYRPDRVEEKVTVSIPELECKLISVFDLIDENKTVVDFKTAGRRYSENAANKSIQLAAYDYAYEKSFGEKPRQLVLDVLVDNGSAVGRQVLSVSSDPERINRLFYNRAKALLQAIQSGSFPPCDPDSWTCSPKWCGYYSTCPYAT